MEQKSIVEIDQNRLDEEWVNQPKLFLEYAEKLAAARLEVSEAKAAIDVIKAQLGAAIRTKPGQYGIIKVTESAIQSVLLRQPEYTKAVKRHNKARYNEDLIQAVVDALEHRKKALESLVFLFGQSYFASPVDKSGKGLSKSEKKKIRQHGTSTLGE